MTKKLGVCGGNLVKFADLAEYTLMLQFISAEISLEDIKFPDKHCKQRFLKKSKKFVLQDNNRAGDWPNGKTLHIYTYASSDAKVPSGTKLFVPPGKEKIVLEQFHGTNGIAGHLGRNRLHPAVNHFIYIEICRFVKHIMILQNNNA
jgi:hypothetical protein